MALTKAFLLKALLQKNYFPAQKRDKGEIPPYISSEKFTPRLAREIVQTKARKGGYDAVEYRATRFNAVSRNFSIPHPEAYAHAAVNLTDHWQHLSYIEQNAHSRVIPSVHRDGRLIIMDYDSSAVRAFGEVRGQFDRHFVVKADISNCFPSIYSHALSWATVGFTHAKKNQASPLWFNKLDACARNLKRNETQGIAIGPATSNIYAELILARVDFSLANKKRFVFERYIDDYTAYCRTEEDAECFIQTLERELSQYKLLLNLKKTSVRRLPVSSREEWITELALMLPQGANVSISDAVNYLAMATALSREVPDGSVMKYAIRSLTRTKLDLSATEYVLEFTLGYSQYQPILLPLISHLMPQGILAGNKFPYKKQLRALASQNARLRRSDGLAWSIHYLRHHGVPIGQKLTEEIIAAADCVSLLGLYLAGGTIARSQIISMANGIVNSDHYGRDQYWLLLYEMFCAGLIKNPYPGEKTFALLKKAGVSFAV